MVIDYLKYYFKINYFKYLGYSLKNKLKKTVNIFLKIFNNVYYNNLLIYLIKNFKLIIKKVFYINYLFESIVYLIMSLLIKIKVNKIKILQHKDYYYKFKIV